MSELLVWARFIIPGEGPILLLATQAEHDRYTATHSYQCEHTDTEYRLRTIKGGGLQKIRQCLNCGRAVGNAAKKTNNEELPRWDDLAPERLENHRTKVRGEIIDSALKRTAELEFDGYSDYEEYLGSEKWAEKRQKVLRRDLRRCQACLDSEATQVHHLTYDRIFEEPLFDLVSVCRPCHERLHRKKIAALAAAKAKSEKIPD